MNFEEPETSADVVSTVLNRAAAAAKIWSHTDAGDRLRVLLAVADALDEHSEELVRLAAQESHLSVARLTGELVRTVFQWRYLAEAATQPHTYGALIDEPDADWPAGAPRPDLRRWSIPLGVVVNFEASNFPFAFGAPGGDTAAGLAAGCPVVVKIHPAHSRLSIRVLDISAEALTSSGAPDGLLSGIEGRRAGVAVLTNPVVKAATFTGSTEVGRALFDIANSRPEPIPFYGELGSVNPVFVTAEGSAANVDDIVDGFLTAVTASAGQLCTKPGVLVVQDGSALHQRLRTAVLPSPGDFLTDQLKAGFLNAVASVEAAGVSSRLAGSDEPNPEAVLLEVRAEQFLAHFGDMFVECFGPAAIVVTYTTDDEIIALAQRIQGQLTASIFGAPTDHLVEPLLAVLIDRAGRLLWNQWPTGVSVTDAQHHGGPYPASTDPRTTSVGRHALGRFLRPIVFQGFPEELLPRQLRSPQ
jgi:NADP-dependent aldehyde dehydrogenase